MTSKMLSHLLTKPTNQAQREGAASTSESTSASPATAPASSAVAPVSRCPFARIVALVTTSSLAARLKESTTDLHHTAEHHPLQQTIVRGTISRGEYAEFARAMRGVHEVMERELETLALSDVRVRPIFLPRHRRLDMFDRDIALLAHDPIGHTRCVTASPIDWLGGNTRNNPLAWLGVLYVVEGSSNGGQVIARVLRKAWSLNDDTLKSLDPHDKCTREYWGEFRTTLDAQRFSAAEQDAIVSGAAATFRGITELMDSLVAMNTARA